MTLSAEAAGANRLAAVMQSLSARVPGELAARFAEELFARVDAGELEAYDPASLALLAAGAFESFRIRPPGEPKVVLRERTLKGMDFLAIDIVNNDMPFLLNSVVSELRGRGLVPELVAHPIFEVRRDRKGELSVLRAGPTPANGVPRESFIHLQIRKTGPLPPAGEITDAILRVLADVNTVVSDFEAMTGRLERAIAEFEANPPPAAPEVNAEATAFLRWLNANNFIFLGIREYDYTGGRNTGQLLAKPDTGLGLLRDESMLLLRRGQGQPEFTPQIRGYFLNSPPVIVAKGNSISTVHRRAHWDIIGIKLYGTGGKIAGQLRIAGLFAASAYNLSVLNIPLLRHKAATVLQGSGYPAGGHSERALLNALETFPRDELFQSPVEQLARIAGEIVKTDLTPRARVFIRRDEFERFISAFVYVPRERYDTGVRVAIVKALEEAFGGRLESFTPFFPEGAMVRIHFVIWRTNGALKEAAEESLERAVEKIVRTWGDDLRERILTQYGSGAGYRLAEKYLPAFPAGYQETNRPSRALEDIRGLETLGPNVTTEIDIHREDPADGDKVRATLLQVDRPVTLSARVPIFENMGFDVISERTFELTPKLDGGAGLVYLHDTGLHLSNGGKAELFARRENLEKGFLAIWSGAAANDRYNGLILGAGLDWRQAALLRAYGAYYRQTGTPHGTIYVAEVLNKHARVAASLFELFDRRFNPAGGPDADAREAECAKIAGRIAAALDKIPVLDEDRILRNLLTLINATLRTNFYQQRSGEPGLETIAFKLKSSEIDWLPAPKPFAEIFVYSPRFEGIHLRGGPIARGGIRWSDRPQDFRSEVLSLAKAQQVKNVVIVPQGAKGGFVPRRLLANREASQAEGIACYKAFVSSLLSLTDNRVGAGIVPPECTIRRDGDNSYLVVAADKGTATFSDVANGIALGRNFWLGDAFASGGSAGYDHKGMGITAKGAWEAVKRHFREMNVDIQTTPFTVAGVGDMSGDVFGNGMLLSKATKLVAAFDHRDIFIDPDPDPAASFEERQRLFNLPRSSWQDYNRAKISKGGGVYSRSEKYIALPAEALKLLGVGASVPPAEIMAAIVKAPVDLLWFGGIGTYVRGSGETDAQVNDKANDAIRVAARELQANVIGEGANLGVTQRGRIEFALLGGRINTDAIDNSAGVNTSDAEVNLKIALGSACAAGKLDTRARNELLAAMTDEVAASVLRNNYLQTLAISLAEMDGVADLGFQQRLMQKARKAGPSQPRARRPALGCGDCRTRRREQAPDAARACGSARLCQDRSQPKPHRLGRAGRSASRPRAHGLFPAADARALRR